MTLTFPIAFFAAAALAVTSVSSSCAPGTTTHASAPGLTYYVRPGGNDAARGTGWRTAWRTVTRVNAARLGPGDTVLFRGGAVFRDSTLMPATSGSSDRPIRFSSFGRGMARIVHADGAVWVSARHDLVFDRLWLSSAGSTSAVVAGSRRGSSDIEVSRSVLVASRGAGINAPSADDRDWRLTCNTIADVGDSGVIIVGSGFLVSGNRIRNTGWNSLLEYGKHGIYAKGERPVIEANQIEGFADSGISLRSTNSRVRGNTISGGPIAIAFHDESTGVGHSVVERNLGYDLTSAGFYYAPDGPGPGIPPSEAFTVASNRFLIAPGAVGLDVGSAPKGLLSASDNTTEPERGTGQRPAPTSAAGPRACSSAGGS